MVFFENLQTAAYSQGIARCILSFFLVLILKQLKIGNTFLFHHCRTDKCIAKSTHLAFPTVFAYFILVIIKPPKSMAPTALKIENPLPIAQKFHYIFLRNRPKQKSNNAFLDGL